MLFCDRVAPCVTPRPSTEAANRRFCGLTRGHLPLEHQADRATIADFVEATLVERSDLIGQLLVGVDRPTTAGKRSTSVTQQ
jgi:hypothetical protein